MNLLIIGLGSMGKRRARLIESLGAGHALTGVDRTPERRSEAVALGLHCHPDLAGALAAGPYDAAFVCTAPLTHAALIGDLLDAGLPVFTELNLVADGYEALMEKARAKNLTLFMSSTMLYRAETRYIIDAVAAFEKPVNYIYHIGQYLPDWHPWESYKDFFVGDARTGGVREILGIELPWLLTAFGPVEKAQASYDTLSGLGLPYPDTCFATLHHQNGARGFLAADVVSPKAVRRFEAFGEGLHLFWEGNPRTLSRWDIDKGAEVPVDTYTSFEQDGRYSDNIVENAYLDEIIEFFDVLEGKKTPRWSLAQDLAALQLIDRMESQA